MKETELAKLAIAWLHHHRWDVFQEVQTRAYGPRADIVGVMGPRIWVIEAKMTLSFGLMMQAERWLGRANMVSVCVPCARNAASRNFAERVLERYGIGMLEVTGGGNVHQRLTPKLMRRTSDSLRDGLAPEHRDFAPAGNADSFYYTPYQRTCKCVQECVKNSPGATVREIVDAIDHHYAKDVTARSALLEWGKSGHIRGVEVRYDGNPKRYRFYPSGGQQNGDGI